MPNSRGRGAFAVDLDPTSRTGPRRRDSDWGGRPRTHEEDVAWAAKRAAVTLAAATIHARDGGTGTHSDDVVHLCCAIADDLGVYGQDRAELLAAAQLHDIGKVTVPNEVLNKPGALDDSEWALIRDHTLSGEKIIRSVPELREVARVVRHSHERWDGRGYPDGLAGEEIPLASRIVFCADAYHAVRSDRPYRRGRSARAALQEVKRNAGSQFDPRVVESLERCAGDVRRRARGATVAPPMTLRSRRLTSLLLVLAVGGSAIAAETGQLFDEQGDRKRATPSAPGASRSQDAVKPRVSERRSARDAATGRSGGASGGPEAGAARKRGRASRSNAPARRRSGVPAAAPTAPPTDVPRRTRTGRPPSPGRSHEAPGKPAQPGKPPVSGAPGRSEEAPGRPAQPGAPPSARRAPAPDGSKLPPAAPRGNAKAG